LLEQLVTEMPDVCESTRGEGLLRGLVLRPGLVARDVLPRLHEAGVLLIAAGERVLRFAPPLVVSIRELEEGVGALRRALADVRAAA
jgi:acetylornithine/succinyldiaminopimelate/putrescine aminotransferase